MKSEIRRGKTERERGRRSPGGVRLQERGGSLEGSLPERRARWAENVKRAEGIDDCFVEKGRARRAEEERVVERREIS
eukprot:scaffold107853_cov19-Tisochrysis_lutea.AAC.1